MGIYLINSKPVSRVLSFKTVIYLMRISLCALSHLPGRCRANLSSSIRCCYRWGLHQWYVTIPRVSSYLTFPPLPKIGGNFLLHYPWSRLHKTLSCILPYVARTFLTHRITPYARNRPAYYKFIMLCRLLT